MGYIEELSVRVGKQGLLLLQGTPGSTDARTSIQIAGSGIFIHKNGERSTSQVRNRLANTGDVTSEKRVITVVRVPCRGDRGLTGWILTHKEDREESTVVQGHVGRSVGGGGQ